MAYAMSMQMSAHLGVDRKQNVKGGKNNLPSTDSPNGIIVETLLNIRTVAALSLEEQRYDTFRQRLREEEADNCFQSAKIAASHGFAYLLHHWVDALLLYFAAWILHTYPSQFTFLDMLNSNFALYFSLFGLGVALKEIADREAIKKATSRVFYLLDRQSKMDPLSKDGLKLT